MTSFPYLKIAREFGCSYGHAVRLAQEIEDYLDYKEEPPRDELNSFFYGTVVIAVLDERRRRGASVSA